MSRLLRDPDEGADTAVWLATAAEALQSSGDFWHDRRRWGERRLPWTRNGTSGAALWNWCVERTGADAATAGGLR
jgi:hypothetical protein